MKASVLFMMLLASVYSSNGEQIPAPLSFQSVSAAISSQSFAFLRVHRMANDASVNWGISNPLEAAYFVIERSDDGSFFQTVAEIQASGAASYRYRDVTAIPGLSYYRILCINSDGSVTQSETVDLRIVRRK